MLRLHRFLHDRYKLRIQTVQVHLVMQPGGEPFESLSRVILLAVEASVYERLNTAT